MRGKSDTGIVGIIYKVSQPHKAYEISIIVISILHMKELKQNM